MEVLFSFGTSKQFPFQGGYIIIDSDSRAAAISEFRRRYPDINEGIINCSDIYTDPVSIQEFKSNGNLGKGCHMYIKSYKEFPKECIGESDIASLTLRGPDSVAILNFGGDNYYQAYMCDENASIGEHYEKAFESEHWLRIYDDYGLQKEIKAEKITVYQAGSYGCIIQTKNERQIENFKCKNKKNNEITR